MLCGGQDVPFELENGPDVITNNLKHRQELNALAQVMPPEMQPIVAVHMCDTIDSDFVEGVKADLIANLGQNLKIVSDKATDPVAIHEMERMKGAMDEAMLQLEQLQEENRKLKLQNDSLIITAQNNRDRTMLDLAKHNDQMALDEAKLQLDAAKAGVEMELDITKAQTDLADKALEVEERRLNLAEDAMGVTDDELSD
jgi:hypothetical protein